LHSPLAMMANPKIHGERRWGYGLAIVALSMACGDDSDGIIDDDDGDSTGVTGGLSTSSTSNAGTATSPSSSSGSTGATTGEEPSDTGTVTAATAGETGSDSTGLSEDSSGTMGESEGTGSTGTDGVDPDGSTGASETVGESSTGDGPRIACSTDDGSLELPDGFCASIFADGLGVARQLAVLPSGDVFVAIAGDDGGVVGLRDIDGDGVADEQESFGEEGGNGIAWAENTLYVALNDRILRYTLPDGELTPTGEAEVVVEDLPDTGDHYAKTVVVAPDGALLVNIASATNACQIENREVESPGVDPCDELEIRAGIWWFDGSTTGQTQADGTRFATGIRNANALAIDPATGTLWAAQNGRDQLYENWPAIYTMEDDARLPAEEIFPVTEDADYGWPYCYFDPIAELKVLAPEYGGDGVITAAGDHDCALVEGPAAVLPAHVAPLSMHFYGGDTFPAAYREGVFVANHGSRFAPDAEDPPGYEVVFIPFEDGLPAAIPQVFADGFAGDGRPLPDEAEYRPVGLAEAPDGSLYISDDWGGRIWRVFYAP